MKIALSVHGRFSAFGIARGFVELKQDVNVFTNYPRWAAARFGLPPEIVHSFTAHGVASRAANYLGLDEVDAFEAALKQSFGRWSARQIRKNDYEAVDCWSGCAEEVFDVMKGCKLLTRSSAHIRVQAEILEEESRRSGKRLQMPGKWIIAREEREYEMADVIVVPSRFAASTFPEKYAKRIFIVNLTAAADEWRPSADVMKQREARVSERRKLRVLYVGMVSFRKGMYDLDRVARALPDAEFKLVGELQDECKEFAANFPDNVEMIGHVAQNELRDHYAWADVFFFPSIEDGFAVVLAQALSAAVPVVSTRNTGAPDLLDMGGQGWVCDARDAETMIEHLRWCQTQRDDLLAKSKHLYENPIKRDWKDVALDEVRAMQSVKK